MHSESERLVQLQGGLVVPVEPLLLLLELEQRGFRLEREGDDTLVVRPYDRLTRVDCDRIRRWKSHLLALIAYTPPRIQ